MGRQEETYLLPRLKLLILLLDWKPTYVSDTGIQFKWDSSQDRRKMWRKDFDLHGAFHASCLPCYQELATNVGLETMQQYVDRLSYGDMIVDSSSLDNFWIKGESGVSQGRTNRLLAAVI